MNKKERAEKIGCAFNKIINSGKEGAFVVFTNPDTGKFVQFAYDSKEKLFTCDIPLDELTKEEEKNIQKLFEAFVATDANTGEKISYQQNFHLNVIDAMTELVEDAFTTIFHKQSCYDIECELNLGLIKKI